MGKPGRRRPRDATQSPATDRIEESPVRRRPRPGATAPTSAEPDELSAPDVWMGVPSTRGGMLSPLDTRVAVAMSLVAPYAFLAITMNSARVPNANGVISPSPA